MLFNLENLKQNKKKKIIQINIQKALLELEKIVIDSDLKDTPIAVFVNQNGKENPFDKTQEFLKNKPGKVKVFNGSIIRIKGHYELHRVAWQRNETYLIYLYYQCLKMKIMKIMKIMLILKSKTIETELKKEEKEQQAKLRMENMSNQKALRRKQNQMAQIIL